MFLGIPLLAPLYTRQWVTVHHMTLSPTSNSRFNLTCLSGQHSRPGTLPQVAASGSYNKVDEYVLAVRVCAGAVGGCINLHTAGRYLVGYFHC